MIFDDIKVGTKLRFIKHSNVGGSDYRFSIGDIVEVWGIDMNRISLLHIKSGDNNWGIPKDNKHSLIWLNQFEIVKKTLSDLIMR